MTIEDYRPDYGSSARNGSVQRRQEDALQAYVRRLHEAGAGQAGDDGEPQRGRDPWLGLTL